MSLLETYKQKNLDENWVKMHSSSAKKTAGKMFEYSNTNFRTQNTFITQFSKFLAIDSKTREEWEKQANHGQEKDKHRVVNMLQSKLFKREVDGIYTTTTKGKTYKSFIDSEIQNEERWLVNYLFLINGYYFNTKNYIIHTVKENLLNRLQTIESLDFSSLIKKASDLIKLEDKSLEQILLQDFFYIHSFYDDEDFLLVYLRAPAEEKKELADYILANKKDKTYECCISKKYKPGGIFNIESLIDETKVFLLTSLFVKLQKTITVPTSYAIFVNNFNEYIAEIDKKEVLAYLHKNKDIFDPIFEEILELEDSEQDSIPTHYKNLLLEAKLAASVDQPEEYIDETSESGKTKIKSIFNERKRMAKIESKYTCILENINNCKSVYFTAKSTKENYLEIHHFLPQEFRNDFLYSIEVLANYVTLCPRCHRQIHLAVDRERKHLINSIYENRQERLKLVGLDVERANIYKYYNIEE